MRTPIRPFTNPEEEDSVLNSLIGKVGGGIGWAGAAIGKTGDAVRGVLGGRPSELAKLLPFSDTLGLTDQSTRVSGEDLAKQWGLLEGDGTKGTFEMRDLLGPAIEIATELEEKVDTIRKNVTRSKIFVVLPGGVGEQDLIALRSRVV